MKKVVCFLLCACTCCLFGCDSDSEENTWNDLCESFFSGFDQAKLNTLGKDRLTQVKDTYIESCAKLYSGMPNCEEEVSQYYKCLYLDHTREYWDEQNRLEDECDEKYSTASERDACVDKLYQACKSLEKTSNVCWEKNESTINAYFNSSKDNPNLTLKPLFDSWGLDVEEYMGDESGDNYDE